MFQAGNQECSHLCLVVAGDLPTAHGFYKSRGVLSRLGVVQQRASAGLCGRSRGEAVGSWAPIQG